VVFARSGWTGQQSIGHTWGGEQASDFWSLRVLVVATLSAACSAVSNWSHDIGGYLGIGWSSAVRGVAPVLEDEAREREVALPHGEWIETGSGRRVRGGGEHVVDAPLERIPVWVRAGSIVVTYPASHVARGLGDVDEAERPLVATLWGEPRLGHAFGQAGRRNSDQLAARPLVGLARARDQLSSGVAVATGSVKSKREPVPGPSDSAQISPPWARMIFRQIDSPSPVPAIFCRSGVCTR
jgi:hypothetical protein